MEEDDWKERVAFWCVDEECDDDDRIFNVSVHGLSGLRCEVRIPEYYNVDDLKTEIARLLRVAKMDIGLSLCNGQALKSRQPLGAIFRSCEIDVSVNLIVARPSCKLCGTRDGLWGRRAQLICCELCQDAYYCSRDCKVRDWGRHRGECF